MTEQELQEYTNVLLAEQKELTALKASEQASTQAVALDQSSVGRLSRMDAMQSQAMALEGKRRRDIQLTRIQAALERIEEGEYGYCASCDEEINVRRLKVDPANPFCVECASKI